MTQLRLAMPLDPRVHPDPWSYYVVYSGTSRDRPPEGSYTTLSAVLEAGVGRFSIALSLQSPSGHIKKDDSLTLSIDLSIPVGA